MGYNIIVVCKSKQAKFKMLSFLKENYKNWDELFGKKPFYNSSPKDVENTLKIEMYYSAGNSHWEREYFWSMLNWIALKVGKTRKFEDGTFPYIKYSCESEYIPIKPTTHNELGVVLNINEESDFYKTFFPNTKLEVEALMTQMIRLDVAWNNCEKLRKQNKWKS